MTSSMEAWFTDDGKSPLNSARADVLKKEKVGPIPPPKYNLAAAGSEDLTQSKREG